MERTFISWSPENIITIWLMLAVGLFVFAIGTQFAKKYGLLGGGSSAPANNTGGY
jgi:hypothetical protein